MVWDTPFEEGNFDQTDTTMGTGIRVRDNEITFVTASDTLSRIQYYVVDETLYASNSTPALLAVCELTLLDDYDYVSKLVQICQGIDSISSDLPVDNGSIRLIYFKNIQVKGGEIREVFKPRTNREFSDYGSFRAFLKRQIQRVLGNTNSPSRTNPIHNTATCSRGYDSPAIAVILSEAGVNDAVTVKNARIEPSRLFDHNDSGAEIAKYLGMDCRSYSRHQANYQHEDAIWSALGNVGDLNLTLFDYPDTVSLLWVAFGAGKNWAVREGDYPLLSRLNPNDMSGLKFCEARLELGVLLCSPPMWVPL